MGLGDVRVIGLAKREEEIFTEGAHESILLDKSSAALHLIQHIRDEAHRFAITYHRKRLAKRNLVSVLDHIEGIGPKRRAALWQRFASLEKMREASVDDLEAVPTMTRTAAEKLSAFLHASASDKRTFIK